MINPRFLLVMAMLCLLGFSEAQAITTIQCNKEKTTKVILNRVRVLIYGPETDSMKNVAIEKAKAIALERAKERFKCGECDDDLPDCEMYVKTFPDPTYDDDAGAWVYPGGKIEITIRCRRCPVKPVDGSDSDSSEGGTRGDDHSHLEQSSSTSLKVSDMPVAMAGNETPMIQRIYPNPVQDKVTLEINVAQDHSTIQIELYDLTGKKVYQESLQDVPESLSISSHNLQEVPNGTYILNVRVNNQLAGTSKISVSKH
ncbi:T9SS type A sorting domain-containing protein [bacterium SCSIO 12741]|nr:T9SS type A sorting domain-containing protein [bacterium SCSIO 12741]